MTSKLRRKGPSKAAAAVDAPPATRAIELALSGSTARKRSIVQVTDELDQSSRHIALDFLLDEKPTSTPITVPSASMFDPRTRVDWRCARPLAYNKDAYAHAFEISDVVELRNVVHAAPAQTRRT